MATEVSVTRAKMVEEAQRRGWKVSYFGPEDFYYRITTPEGKSCSFHGSIPQTTSWIGANISLHKLDSLYYLQSRGIKTAPFILYDDHQMALDFLQKHQPIVVKPEDSEQSKGVTVGITTPQQLSQAVQAARLHSKKVLLQKQLEGQLYRVLVIGGTFFAASCRKAAFVTGNGTQTIEELINTKNDHRWRGEESTSILKTIKISDVSEYLGADVVKRIPMAGEEVKVLPIDSVSAGGEAEDVTDRVHQSYRDVVESIAQELDIVSCGVDIITPDIEQPLHGTFPFLEVNAMPGFKMHYYPSAGGLPRDPAVRLLNVTLGEI